MIVAATAAFGKRRESAAVRGDVISPPLPISPQQCAAVRHKPTVVPPLLFTSTEQFLRIRLLC
jgi:hypothetical protein